MQSQVHLIAGDALVKTHAWESVNVLVGKKRIINLDKATTYDLEQIPVMWDVDKFAMYKIGMYANETQEDLSDIISLKSSQKSPIKKLPRSDLKKRI